MRRRVVQPLLVVALLAVAGVAAAWAVTRAQPLKGPPARLPLFGYVRSLVRQGAGYELRLDPALLLTGTTAQRAAVDDHQLNPGETLDNDYYIRNPEHSLLTFRVPATARATVVTTSGIGSTSVGLAELAQIERGGNPRHRALVEQGSRRTLGFWVVVAGDSALSLDEQYLP